MDRRLLSTNAPAPAPAAAPADAGIEELVVPSSDVIREVLRFTACAVHTILVDSVVRYYCTSAELHYVSNGAIFRC